MRFSEHALARFAERRERYGLPGDPPAAYLSYRSGQPVTRKEASRRIRGHIRPPQPRLGQHDATYRTDGTGPGIWVLGAVIRGPKTAWRVLTYLAPGDSGDEVAAAVEAAAEGGD